MPETSTLPLLGLADELSASEAPLGDEVAEGLLRHLLDRVVDGIVDVTQGRHTLSRPDAPSPDVPRPSDAASPSTQPPVGRASASRMTGVADRGECSALAARCHRAAALLRRCDDQTLASHIVVCLETTGSALQRLVQDRSDEPPGVARQRLLRTLRAAAAVLDEAAP
ncbi:MAG TPA: hypothetical protein VK045_02675 [Ornithinicoccus sp.]|nr:hypothetical protein [Ornithinicoccus sp.]